MRVTIARRLLDEIRAHAAESRDVEACGLLFGQDDAIERVLRAANVHPDPARHFEVDPAILFSAIRAERAGGDRLIGHYHSHPSGACAPSARDRADAEPGRLWLIVAGDAAGLWRATGDGFADVEMKVVP